MADETASFHINLKSGELTFSGSEDFVTAQIEENRDVIDKMLSQLQEAELAKTHENAGDRSSGSERPEDMPPFPNVFGVSDDKVSVIADVPGSTDKDKTINLTHLYLLGKSLLLNEETADFDEIREACKEHGCYNSSNFSTYVKGAKVITNGTDRSQSAELTHPGKEKARALAEELNRAPH